MDWLKHWNQALDYLEENLDGDIRLEELGHLAGRSAYHFQRMFSYLAGVPLSEYIRRRRMTRAAVGPRQAELFPLMGGEPAGMLGVSTCNEEENYGYIAVASYAPIPEGMREWTPRPGRFLTEQSACRMPCRNCNGGPSPSICRILAMNGRKRRTLRST